MSALTVALDRLKAEVAEAKTVADSAKALITNLAQQIRDNALDPAALPALADALDASDTSLATAVTDNTPAAPPVTPPVTPATPPANQV